MQENCVFAGYKSRLAAYYTKLQNKTLQSIEIYMFVDPNPGFKIRPETDPVSKLWSEPDPVSKIRSELDFYNERKHLMVNFIMST